MALVCIAGLLASSVVDRAVHLDPERVRGCAELLGELLPVVALGTDQGLLLADGCHWVAAVRARGLDSLEGEI